MSVFMLETDAVTSAASTLESLANQVSTLSSSVAGYDTACEDGFNFAGAKNVIAQNIEACRVKIANTVALMNNVVNSHTQLQNSLKFTDPTTTATTPTPGSSSTGGGSSYSGGGSSYSGGGSSYSGGGSSYSGGGGGTIATALPAITTTTTEGPSEVKTELNTVGYAYPDAANLADESKKLFTSSDFGYAENGYGMIGERYVISCDPSVGKVGDVIRFTKSNGEVVECVVGVNTVSTKYKNSINFMINKDAASTFQVAPVSENLVKDLKKVQNFGNYQKLRSNDPITVVSVDKGVSV